MQRSTRKRAPLVVVFGLASVSLVAFAQQKQAGVPPPGKEASAWEHRVTGKVLSAKDVRLQVEIRENHSVQIDATEAIKNHRAHSYAPGTMITVYGAYDVKGVFHAQSIQRAKTLSSAWPEDR